MPGEKDEVPARVRIVTPPASVLAIAARARSVLAWEALGHPLRAF